MPSGVKIVGRHHQLQGYLGLDVEFGLLSTASRDACYRNQASVQEDDHRMPHLIAACGFSADIYIGKFLGDIMNLFVLFHWSPRIPGQDHTSSRCAVKTIEEIHRPEELDSEPQMRSIQTRMELLSLRPQPVE